MNSWGEAGPPEEAYGRVTDAGRFAPLHTHARRVLDDLEACYAVTRETCTEPDHHGDEPATVVRLIPADPAAAPLTVVFTAFPGLIVRTGGAGSCHLPACGCDACAETFADCADELDERIDALVAGDLGERLIRDHGWWHEQWYRARYGESSSRTSVSGDELAKLRAALPGGELRWTPWPTRTP